MDFFAHGNFHREFNVDANTTVKNKTKDTRKCGRKAARLRCFETSLVADRDPILLPYLVAARSNSGESRLNKASWRRQRFWRNYLIPASCVSWISHRSQTTTTWSWR